MKILIFILLVGCFLLSIFAIIRKKQLKKTIKKTKNYTPKLSSLHGKKFSDYIDDLRKGL